jgi:colicin import membrane protein
MGILKQKISSHWIALGDYRLPVVVAVLLHVILIILLITGLGHQKPYTQMSSVQSKPQVIVKAEAVPARVIQKKLDRIAADKRAVREKIRAQKRAAALKIKRARALKVKRARLRLAQKKAAQAKVRAQRLAKAARAALQKKRNIKRQKIASLKALQQKLQKTMVAEQLKADSARIASANAAAMNVEVDRYKTAILQAISQNWYVPGNVSKEISCLLMVRLAPNGDVLDVSLLKGSGSAVLDRSAVSAVYKSSPLPVPTNRAIFDKFRELRLTVRPLNAS